VTVILNLAGKQDLKSKARRRHPVLMGIFICSAILAVVLVAIIAGWSITHMPSLPGQTSGLRIYDRNDKLLCVKFEDRDFYPVPLKKVSKNIQNAIITSEDRSFYTHHGIDPTGVTRAIFTDIKARKMLQGGSTLTQQLIKNLYFSSEKRTLTAKLEEVILAIELDLRYSKELILETYLNYVYFGKGCYGIERAAEKYFGKTAGTLSLAESAYLAGLVNAPSELSTKEHHDDAVERQQQILSDMAKLGYVSEEQATLAQKEKLGFKQIVSDREGAAYYLEYVIKNLQAKFSESDLWSKGWKVYTNVDPLAQAQALKVLTEGIYKAPVGVSQGALVSISVHDGGVLAMVGGAGSFEKSPWNRALSPHTAGSAFKPFVYLTGIRTGQLQPTSVIDDSPLTLAIAGKNETYSPKNFDGQFMGPLSVRMALALSRNVCAVRVAQMVGIKPIIDTARAAGVIDSKLEPTIALALGASAVTPLEMANSYATFARGGIYLPPTFIRKVLDADGKVLSQEQPLPRKVFDAEPVAQLVDVMRDVVNLGTGKGARLDGREVAGKTGTADGARDVWFVGFTPDTATAVWAGNDGDKPIAGKSVTGGSVTAGIWRNYMNGYYAGHHIPGTTFTRPLTAFIEPGQVRQALEDGATIQGINNPAAGSLSGAQGNLAPGQQSPDGAYPPLAPDYRENRKAERKAKQEADKIERDKHKGAKKGGIGHLFHKIFDAFN
jgi:penicillin-binding protein 1A